MTQTSALLARARLAFGLDRTSRRVLGAAASAALVGLALAPIHAGWLAFVALVPLHLSLRGATRREAALLGFGHGFAAAFAVFGFAFAFPGFGLTHAIAGAAYLALYPAALAVVWSRVAARPAALVYVPATAVAVDWARGHAGALALPWGTLGETQHENHLLLQLASLGGVPLVTFVVVLANVAFAQLAVAALRRRAIAALAVVGAAHALGLALVPAAREDARTLRVAVVQPDFVPGVGRPDEVVTLDALTSAAAATRPDLVVWPESAAGDVEHDDLAALRLRAVVDRAGVPVLAGASSGRGVRGYNSLYLVRPDEAMTAPYHKVRLVPFAEEIPASLAGLGLRPRFDTIAGDARRPFALDGSGVTIEPLVCFESVFADDVRRVPPAAASVIVVAANDAWLGRGPGPALHNVSGVFRAVESRRPVVIASNRGPSQIVDASGRVLVRAPERQATTIEGEVRVDLPPSVYRRVGDAGWMLALGAAVVATSLTSRARRRATS